MAWYRIAENVLDAIADAINAKTGGSSPMTPVEMVLEIQSIPTGGGGTDRLKTAEVTLTQDYAVSPSTSTSVMALCESAIGTANYIVLQKSTTKTEEENLRAMFYGGIKVIALGNAAPLNKNILCVLRLNSDGTQRDLQGTFAGLAYNCLAWAGDVYQVWGWD